MTTPQRWIRADIRTLNAYHTPDGDGLIKLDAMENPYPMPTALQSDWQQHIGQVSLNRYPDPQARTLKPLLRQRFHIPDAHALVLGNGSDELIQLILTAVHDANRCILAPAPSFVMYAMIATTVGMPCINVPLRDDFDLCTDTMVRQIRRHQPAAIFLASPNNPTGNPFSAEAVAQIIEASEGLVVLDEAYRAFNAQPLPDTLRHHPRVLLMGTLSKLGLAGARLGFLSGAPQWLQELNKIRLPYNTSSLDQQAACFMLNHYPTLQTQIRAVCQSRQQLHDALTHIPGITPFPSQANFILMRTPAGRANPLWQHLKQSGILVKDVSRTPMLHDCLRITIGQPHENAAFLQSLKAGLDD